jgi:hypothetical protein
MRASTVIAFLGGAFPIALGYALAPPPYAYCDLSSTFPVTKAYVQLASCLDCEACTIEPSRAAFTIITFSGLFLISGAFAARLAKTRSILKAIVPAAVSVTFFLMLMASNREFLLWPTLLMGAGVLGGAVLLAAAGAAVGSGDA